MSSRQGGGKNTPFHRRQQDDQTEENWFPKPIINHDIRAHDENPSSPSTSHPNDHDIQAHDEPQLVKNSDKGKKKDEGSNGGSVSRLNFYSNCLSGLVSELSLGTNSGARVEGIEGPSNSSNLIDDDDVKRLEELRLSDEEIELSEGVMSINNQLQEDELLAMESIYGDNSFVLDSKSGLKCFQTHIHIELLKGISITANLNSSNSHDKMDQDFSYSFRVEYIPPIILTCLLPKSYPSNQAPYFSLSAQWLSSCKVSNLCLKLDEIWKEQAGQEVIHQWVEWLQSCTLSYLCFDDEIVLGPYGVRCGEDKRAISRSVSPDIDIPLLKSYNDEQRHEHFCRNIQQCCICFGEFAGSEFIKLPCQHFFCWKCMKTFSDIHITEGTVMKLHCPESKCGGMIPPGLLKRLLGEEEFERWETLTLQKTLESMSDVVYCPRCETACLEDEGNHAQCSKCFYSFCTLCKDRRHVGIQCMALDVKLHILEVRQNSNLIRGDQRRREADMINEIHSFKEIRIFAKQCPSCKIAISRTGGCNKMACPNCGAYFCYRCNKEISGYEHYSGKNSCALFPPEEIKRWEEMNVRRVGGQMQARMFADNGLRCPACRQPNVKVGSNNHIFCRACRNHYCYLCRKMVGRSLHHFGPRGCKQHTG